MSATELQQSQHLATVPQFRFDAVQHRYFWGDRQMSGVTSVLSKTLAKPALIEWAARMAAEHVAKNLKFATVPEFGTLALGDDAFWERVLDEARTAHCRMRDKAGDFGKQCHAQIAAYVSACVVLTGGRPVLPVPPKARHLAAFREWAIRRGITFL